MFLLSRLAVPASEAGSLHSHARLSSLDALPTRLARAPGAPHSAATRRPKSQLARPRDRFGVLAGLVVGRTQTGKWLPRYVLPHTHVSLAVPLHLDTVRPWRRDARRDRVSILPRERCSPRPAHESRDSDSDSDLDSSAGRAHPADAPIAAACTYSLKRRCAVLRVAGRGTRPQAEPTRMRAQASHYKLTTDYILHTTTTRSADRQGRREGEYG